ncbi:MAG: anhydro-N-acetylmuramic acid kinase [Gemmatimonadota bacterium]
MGRRVKVAGLMSGTSMDGIDAALVELPGEAAGLGEGRRIDPTEPFSWELLAFRSVPYSDDRRRRIRGAVEGRAGTEEICALHGELGVWLGEAVHRLCEDAGIASSGLDLIGSHGHTVWHAPPRDPGGRGASLQLGSPAFLAETVGVPVVADFRSADLAAGGQGAPLVPFADRLLFSVDDRSRAIQNLGGMGNVTLLPPRGSGEDVVAFDTGPGVALLDAAAEMATDGRLRFDRDGELASRGTADPTTVNRLMEDPFFRSPPPRSTGRELFGDGLVRELARKRGLVAGRPDEGWPDLLATLVDLTAAPWGTPTVDGSSPGGSTRSSSPEEGPAIQS